MGAIAQHALELRAEKHFIGFQAPIPQAIAGLGQGVVQLHIPVVQVLLQGQALADVAGNRHKVLAPLVLERTGTDLNRHFCTALVLVLAHKHQPLRRGADGLRQTGPLRHAQHVFLQTEHRVRQQLGALHAHLVQRRRVAVKDVRAVRIDQKNCIGQMLEQGQG